MNDIPMKKATYLPPMTQNLVRVILEKNPMHRKFMMAATTHITEQELSHLELYLNFCLQNNISIDYLSDCYLTILGDTRREQIYFQRHNTYRYSTFEEVAESIYFNAEYMSFYMYGLAITSFLWPNHLKILRFFRETLPKAKEGKYLEIGPGHGYFLMTAMEATAYDSFTGVDISETSVTLTRNLVEYFSKNTQKKFSLNCLDFLQCDLPNGSFDAVVMGEVLEHVERPEMFMKQIARIAKKDAYIFITTCINAPAVDHIYLFKDPEQVKNLFDDCDLRIQSQIICPYEGKTLEESLQQRLAINVAYVLEKK